jgi:hypothetical protein
MRKIENYRNKSNTVVSVNISVNKRITVMGK